MRIAIERAAIVLQAADRLAFEFRELVLRREKVALAEAQRVAHVSKCTSLRAAQMQCRSKHPQPAGRASQAYVLGSQPLSIRRARHQIPPVRRANKAV